MKFSNYINGGNDISLDYISYSSLNENKSILSTDETKKLAKYLEAIKSHFYYKLNLQFEELDYFDFAMDIEFKLDKNTRKIYIKQARTY
jgi:phosphoenolpyruvate synthase/pyruvate phosphate dikinase